ncbi:MAG: site-specific integrase [Actinobacteria bacterium]|nr:site-specific integrase [Actinomycetota bacterium]
MGRAVGVQVVSGPLAEHAAGFESWLAARGYSPSAVRHRLWQLDRLSRWLEREGVGAGELTAECAERFLRAHRAAGYVTWISERSMALPLEHLREVGAAPVAGASVAEGPVEELIVRYRRYLVGERALAAGTVRHYERVARLFLSERERPGGLELERLCAGDVTGFLARECPRRSVAGARHLVSELRPLLRYLHVAGVIGAPLAWAVPGVSDQRDRTLPRGLEPAVVRKLLASCDRRRTVGRRDYAILLLLVRLGLRRGEVAALGLDDVDWRLGEILVGGKGGRYDRLPLPVDVGEALVGYLRRRPRDRSRALFLRVLAPAGALSPGGVGGVVNEACVRAGVAPVSAHRLRHTAASEMLRAGSSLAEIGQVLRHRQLQTTAIYAKVDRSALRALARPWPGGGSS